MRNESSDSFRLGTLEDTGEMAPVEEAELYDLQLKKTRRRFRWSLVVVVLLFGVLLAAGYLDLKQRFSMQTNSGIREIENISAVFEDRLNELQKRIDDLGNSLTKDMAALDQKTVVWQKDLAAVRQTVDKLDVSGVVKKEQQGVLQEVRKELAPLEQRIKAIQSDLGGLEQKMVSRITPLSESLASNTQKVEALQNRLGPQSGELVNKDVLDLELLKLRNAYRQNLTDEIAGLEKKIGLLVEKVERLESRLAPGAASSPLPSPSAAGKTPPKGNPGIQEQTLP